MAVMITINLPLAVLVLRRSSEQPLTGGERDAASGFPS